MLVGNSNAEKIWNYFYDKIGNKYGIAGLLGNLYAESALNPKNLQDSFEKRLGYNDNSYTEGVDSGRYQNFVRDSAGYGLAQWTFWSRKQDLLNYVRKQGVSIGDLEGQLGFLWQELQGYKTVIDALKNAKTVREASDVVLLKFEQPADQSISMQEKRASYGQNYFNQFANDPVPTVTTEKKEEKKDTLQSKINALNNNIKQYILSTNTHYISNNGSDENGSYAGGKAGDQTGNEWRMRGWYSSPWNCVLRYENDDVALKIAELGIKAANNDKIGYDQGQRNTYWEQLQKANYDPAAITTACESDCSAGVIANVKATGYLLNIYALKHINATYTGNMRQAFKDAGFKVLTDSKYINSADYLKPGDILLNDVKHTATNVSFGSKVKTGISTGTNTSTPVTVPISSTNANNLTIGSKGTAVKTMQEMLIACGYSCGSYGADGDFGNATYAAVRQFQTENGLLVDGIYGPNSKAKLTALYEAKKKITDSKTIDPYLVKIASKSLNIRQEPDKKSKKVGTIKDQGVYTIVAESNGFGKLKSGAGWILLSYTKKV